MLTTNYMCMYIFSRFDRVVCTVGCMTCRLLLHAYVAKRMDDSDRALMILEAEYR